MRCNLLFVLIGHFGLLKDVNIPFFLSFSTLSVCAYMCVYIYIRTHMTVHGVQIYWHLDPNFPKSISYLLSVCLFPPPPIAIWCSLIYSSYNIVFTSWYKFLRPIIFLIQLSCSLWHRFHWQV